MHKCSKCGQEFEGNFCPNCGTSTNTTTKEQNPVLLKLKSINIKKLLKIVIPSVILLVAVILLIRFAIYPSCAAAVRENNIKKIEMGYTAAQVTKALGTPDDEDTYKFQYYGGEYKSLLKKQQQLENKLMTVDSEKEMEKIFNQLMELEEKMSKLEYPYTEIWFDSDKKVTTVIYNAKKTSDLTSTDKIKKTSDIFPKVISLFSNPYSIEFTAKENYSDNSYYYGRVTPDASKIDTLKSGEYTVEWTSHFNYSSDKDCSGTVTVGTTVAAGTEISGDIGNHTFKAIATKDCNVDNPTLNVTIEGNSQSLTYNKETDTYWTKIRQYISSITMPDSVTSIGEYAFDGCRGLTSITIPNGVTNIGEYAFRGCSGLKSITIPDSVSSISYAAFRGCSRLKEIRFNGTMAQWKTTKKGSDWNYGAGSFTVICTDGELDKNGNKVK